MTDYVWIVEGEWWPVKGLIVGSNEENALHNIYALHSRTTHYRAKSVIFKTKNECIDFLINELEKERDD